MNTMKTRIKSFFTVFIIFHFFFLVLSSQGSLINNNTSKDSQIIGKIVKQLEISPNSDYYIKFYSQNASLECKPITTYSKGLSEKVKNAIAKSPKWIQRDLTRQFKNIDGEEHADLILKTNKQYTDEIAFSIAFSPIGDVPSVDLIWDNVNSLYENDQFLQYADIIDYDNYDGNYYSTIRYKVIEDGVEKQFEYPPEIYYWYVVHTKAGGEQPSLIYDKFWRSYITNHNDIGYPLLKEKLSNIKYLWDCESYFQSKNRTWKWSIDKHPTAIEAVSYWVGKTVPEQAYGDRPTQPNIIAHEHNGWCGELQRIAVAALRSALIPTVGICNYGEDHVWREFFERGWHENDNWWADGGGAVDKPDVYTYDWGKDMSAVFAWKGDDSIFDVTSHYIHPEDLSIIQFKVVDCYFQPVDGARVTVMVKGPVDITFIKHNVWEKILYIWDSLPDVLKGKILQQLFSIIDEKFTGLPNTVDLPISTIWNYTDEDGSCSFNLGKNHEYFFIIQYGDDLRDPPRLARYNKIRVLKNPMDKTYNIRFPLLRNIYQTHQIVDITGDKYSFNINFDTSSYQIHENALWNSGKGVYKQDGKIDFFIVDESNFEKYQQGKSFKCAKYVRNNQSEIDFSCDENNWYLVFRNNAYKSNILLNFSLLLESTSMTDCVKIVSPNTSIFENPIVNNGDTILFKGVANSNIILSINDVEIEVETVNGEWFYFWDTAKINPGKYTVTAICGSAQDELTIEIVDLYPPELQINYPKILEILEKEEITISGQSWDNHNVKFVEVSVDGSRWKKAEGTNTWAVFWDFSVYDVGEHTISAKAYDTQGSMSVKEVTIVINESGYIWGPEILDVYHNPTSPSNRSNIILFADVETGNPFSIKQVVAYWNDDATVECHEMFNYADNPVQDRHEEDPLKNLSNEPVYGLELGQFPSGTRVAYWIVVVDSADNMRVSDKYSFVVN